MTRQGPSSCQSCRAKKLRCDRVQPCSNCMARDIGCEYIIPRLTDTPASAHGMRDMQRRLARLESLLLPRGEVPTLTLGTESQDSQDERDYVELQSLGNICTREDAILSPLAGNITFSVQSTPDIIESAKRGGINAISFPPFRVAMLLFDNYEESVDHVCRVLHNPTVRSLIRTFYLPVDQENMMSPGKYALLLSVFALSASFFQPSETTGVVSTISDATHLSQSFAKGALDVLDYSRRNTSGTLEDVQAYIIMSYVTYHVDGLSARSRHLTTMAMSAARDLRFHQLDSDLVDGPDTSQEIISREVKRRVFWHIVSTDWLQSTVSGPQEGTYFINPAHIDVRLPKDCDDSEIIMGEDAPTAPNPFPTTMTFFLARVRLAKLCRDMTDKIPVDPLRAMRVPYDQIIALDHRFTNFLSGLPYFMRLDHESRERSRRIEEVFPRLPLMRYCLSAVAHTRRCRLHQTFLLRKASDPQYLYSRNASLESARTVIRLFYEPLEAHGGNLTMDKARMGLMVHFTYLALVVLIMDLCVNRDLEDQQRGQRESEVYLALATLQPLRSGSPLLGRCLEGLKKLLERHGVSQPGLQSSSEGIIMDDNNDIYSSVSPQRVELSSSANGMTLLPTELDSSFEDIWRVTTQDVDSLDSFAWETIFSTINSRPI